MLRVIYVVFFFKQKTAYEMRISDWSSDVCSSDLFLAGAKLDGELKALRNPIGFRLELQCSLRRQQVSSRFAPERKPAFEHLGRDLVDMIQLFGDRIALIASSEEHTSELQSLMRFSYAVFCL